MKTKVIGSFVIATVFLGLVGCTTNATNGVSIDDPEEQNYINIDYGEVGAGYEYVDKITTVYLNDTELSEKEFDALIGGLDSCSIEEVDKLPDVKERIKLDFYEDDGMLVCSIIRYEFTDKIYLQDANGIFKISGEEIRAQTDKMMR